MTDDPTLAPRHSAAAKAPLPILLVLSCTIAWVIAQLSYNALPQLLEPIKETFGQSDEVVGRLYGYELVVFAVVALLAAWPLAFLSRVRIALLGGTLAVTAGVVSSATDSYSVLVVCRLMLGMGGALAGAAGTAAAASAANPERVYAVGMARARPLWLVRRIARTCCRDRSHDAPLALATAAASDAVGGGIESLEADPRCSQSRHRGGRDACAVHL